MGAVCLCADQGSKDQAVETLPKQKLIVEKPPQESLQEKEPQLIVTIVGVRGLRDAAWLPGTGKPDCYCELTTGRLMLHATSCIPDTCEPTWCAKCNVMDIATGSPLTFTVYERDLFGADTLGKATLQNKDYATNGFNGELKLQDAHVSQAFIRLKVKVAGKALPPGEPAEIDVTAEKPSCDISFGLDLDPRDDIMLHVMEIRSGPFTDFNSSASPQLQLKQGDAIVSVNGVTGCAEKMVAEFKSQLKVECKVKRTLLTTVILDRGATSEPLGLQFQEDIQGEALVIKGLSEGVAEKHNRSVKPADRFCVSDRVLSVGNVKGNARALKKQLDTQEGKLQLVVRRAASPLPEIQGTHGVIHWLYA